MTKELKMQLSENTDKGVNKLARYGWKTTDTPGRFKMLSKHDLNVPPEYQREMVPSKVKELTAVGSWASCGVLSVANRGGEFFVFDGQHRLLAAMRRSDIQTLPCMVFEFDTLSDEAKAFLGVNTGRKPVTAMGKLKAKACANDEVALFVTTAFEKLKLSMVNTPRNGGELKCVALCQKMAQINRDNFLEAITLCAELSFDGDCPISEKVLDGLAYINTNVAGGLQDARLRLRLQQIGMMGLRDAAARAASYYARGGAKVFASGMLQAVNKGLRNRFEMDGKGSD